MRFHRSLVCFAASTALAGALGAQSKTTTLTKPDATFPEPLTAISSLRELSNGKVMVADGQERTIQLLDFTSGTVTKISRIGQGPNEYQMPGALLPLPSGETLMSDIMSRRFLVFDKDGKPVQTVTPPATGGVGPLAGMADARGIDAKGRVYIQTLPFGAGMKLLDSIAILRWDRAGSKADTAMWIKTPDLGFKNGMGKGAQIAPGGTKAFAAVELWGVGPDGRVARVFPSPYQVVWFTTPSSFVKGPAVPYTPIKVTDADRKAAAEAQEKIKAQIGKMGSGVQKAMANAGIRFVEQEFPETKPPFTINEGIMVSPEGEVWVGRTHAAGDSTVSYDLFDRAGKPSGRALLRPRSRVAGFGRGTVYVARLDDDDLVHLERYRR